MVSNVMRMPMRKYWPPIRRSFHAIPVAILVIVIWMQTPFLSVIKPCLAENVSDNGLSHSLSNNNGVNDKNPFWSTSTIRHEIDYMMISTDNDESCTSDDGDLGSSTATTIMNQPVASNYKDIELEMSTLAATTSTWTSTTTMRPKTLEMVRKKVKNGTHYQIGMINNMSDIVKLVRFVLLRGHIVLDASHRVLVKNESRIDRLMDYLHDIQLRRGKYRILPMEDRDLACQYIADTKLHIKKLCRAATFDCLSASELIQMLPSSTKTFHQAITRLCPLLLFRQSRPICVSDVKKLLDAANSNKKIQLVEPSIERVWIFGVLFVTISILVSMGGLILLPVVKKSSRMTILTFFEGLAVGGLCGSAILHLFPEAFDIVDEKYRTYFWNTTCIFCGIYFSYCIEILIKILKTHYGRNRRKRVPSVIFRDDDVNIENLRYSPAAATTNNPIRLPTPDPYNNDDDDDDEISDPEDYQSEQELDFNFDDHQPKIVMESTTTSSSNNGSQNKMALTNSTRDQLVQCLSTVNVIAPPSLLITPRQTPPTIRRSSKERMVRSVALRRQDHETSTIVIDTVAWMIVLGDALLNFIDGLSIGAAFDRNILAGMSISVAVMLEEVTHRLGTFAVLIRAGMSMKQSFFYIFLSACSCYPGLALGIVLGDEAEDASPYIFALSGGFFLYMALVDVMKAMTRTMENASRKNLRSLLRILALQNIGIVISAISLALLAFYEKEMDFEVQEMDEIRKNSFV
ncbi:zinc transporter zip14-like protein 1 [Dermatophagoides farinae]|uniref:Zinc transporter zip14-like protein 1 n=2 Tax=Dermatophagoides farinae TaxID=6954 RepID=A0A9D4SMB9_DERFA|nr:zinc transporter zip14-like protein 1 [Dermatophagoides farinae]